MNCNLLGAVFGYVAVYNASNAMGILHGYDVEGFFRAD